MTETEKQRIKKKVVMKNVNEIFERCNKFERSLRGTKVIPCKEINSQIENEEAQKQKK